ncbi:MAG: NADP-dependent oxidoreductase [Lautropia sp.]
MNQAHAPFDRGRQRNRRIVLASRPTGKVEPSNFRLEQADIPPLNDGEVLVATEFLSLDPYMRGRMDDAKSYAKPQPLDETMQGGTVGTVVESKDARYVPGDVVLAPTGWQTYGASPASALRKVAGGAVPLSAYLGSVGMPGVTAWYGVNRILQPKAGQTLVVDAASGAVGAVVGQLAKAAGCRVVGIAGGSTKCEVVVQSFGFDACVDHKAGRLREDLKAATPDGIDLVFENVGGVIMDAILARMNAFGRIAVCGLIAGYGGEDIALKNIRSILVNKLMIQGFIISDHLDVWPTALAELGQRVADGSLKYRETITDGLSNAPAAFIGLLSGGNLGKQLVRITEEDRR